MKKHILVNLLTSPMAYKKCFHVMNCVIPSHSVASLKNNVFKNHNRMHDELDYLTLDLGLKTVMADVEEKLSNLLVLDDTATFL
jgi:hypothetical protein